MSRIVTPNQKAPRTPASGASPRITKGGVFVAILFLGLIGSCFNSSAEEPVEAAERVEAVAPAVESSEEATQHAAQNRDAEAKRERRAAAEAKRERRAAAEAKRERRAAAEAKRERRAAAEAKRERRAAAEAKRERRAAAEAKREQRIEYANCTEVKQAGAAPIRRGDPGYSRQLDRDGDGIACET